MRLKELERRRWAIRLLIVGLGAALVGTYLVRNAFPALAYAIMIADVVVIVVVVRLLARGNQQNP